MSQVAAMGGFVGFAILTIILMAWTFAYDVEQKRGCGKIPESQQWACGSPLERMAEQRPENINPVKAVFQGGWSILSAFIGLLAMDYALLQGDGIAGAVGLSIRMLGWLALACLFGGASIRLFGRG